VDHRHQKKISDFEKELDLLFAQFVDSVNKLQKLLDIHLNYPSVGATENLMLASIFSKGVTTISNAAKEGFFSRHNLRYWNGEEYLGFGPGAHSFFRGERFRVKEGVREYLSGRLTDPFCRIADRERILTEDRRTEYIMLSLRKTEGIDCSVLRSLSDEQFCQKTEEKFVLWCRHGLCVKTPRGYALTPEGAFVSNEMISQLI